jgi:hypothetical protein
MKEKKKKLVGKKVDMHVYVMPETYQALKPHANPDDGDRWEAPLLRRIIREWLDAQANQGQRILDVRGLSTEKELEVWLQAHKLSREDIEEILPLLKKVSRG